MSEKPGKRLVSQKEYVRIVVKASILPLILLGEGLGCYFLFDFIFSDVFGRDSAWTLEGVILQCTLLLLVAGAFWFAAGKAQAHVASAISSVSPITRHNTGHLPEVETLVRASDLPPSDPQAELLRGVVPPVQDTPPEELLRAAHTAGQEIR